MASGSPVWTTDAVLCCSWMLINHAISPNLDKPVEDFPVGIRKCVYTRLSKKYTVSCSKNKYQYPLAQQLLCQSDQTFGSLKRGNWGIPGRRILQSDASFPRRGGGCDCLSKECRQNSWTSLLGSVCSSLGTAAGREGAAASAVLSTQLGGCFSCCDLHQGSAAVSSSSAVEAEPALKFAQ